MENKNIALKVNLKENYLYHFKLLEKNRLEMNSVFYGTIKILITLSTAILLASAALTNKIAPIMKLPNLYINILLLSWIFLFISVLCFVFTMLHASQSYSKSIGQIDKKMKKLLQEMKSGLSENIEEVNINESFVNYFPLTILIIGLVLFFTGVINITLCLGFKISIMSLWKIILVDLISLIPVAFLVYSYYKDR